MATIPRRKRLSPAAALTLALSLTLSAAPVVNAQSQEVDSSGCLLLTGSQACRGFQTSYVAPYDGLSSAFPWISDIWNLASFDAAVFKYFNGTTYSSSKFGNSQLGCRAAADADVAIRWQRTALCSRLVNHRDSIACASENSGSRVANQQIACQGTCDQYSLSEHDIIGNTTLCSNGGGSNAQDTIAADLLFCLGGNSSTASPPPSPSTCVNGVDNEDACGWGNSTSQLCAFCEGNADSCCGTVDLINVCGYHSSSEPGNDGGSGSSSPGSTNSPSKSKSKKLSGGAIAGIVIGVIVGVAIIGALVWFLCCRGKRPKKDRQMLMSPNEKHEPGVNGGESVGRTSDAFVTPSSTPPIASNYATGPGTAGTGAGVGTGVAAAGAAAAGGAALAHHNRSASPNAVPAAHQTSPTASNLRNNATTAPVNTANTANTANPVHTANTGPGVPPSSGHLAGVAAGAAAAGAAVAGGAALAHHNRSQRDGSPIAETRDTPRATSTSPTTIRNVQQTSPSLQSSPTHGASHNAVPGALGAAAAAPVAAAAGHHSHPSGPRANPFHDSSAPSVPPGAALQQSNRSGPNAFPVSPQAQSNNFPAPHATGYSSPSVTASPGGTPVGGIFHHNNTAAGPTTHYNQGVPASSSHHGPGLAAGAAVAAGAAGAGAGIAHHANKPSQDQVPATTTNYNNAQQASAAAPAAAASQQQAPPPTARTLPRVEDNNKPGAWIVTGSTVTVLHEYAASLQDEITLKPGMQLQVLDLYDDGWGKGKVISGDPEQVGKVDQFPTVCTTSA